MVGIAAVARAASDGGTLRRPRYGLVGTAHWAGQVHAAAAASSEAVEFVAALGRDEARTRAFSERWAVQPHRELSSFLDQVDVVGLAIPPAAQPELAMAAARAGKHLILEKPVSLTSAAAASLAQVVEEAGVRSVVFLTQRFLPEVEEWIADARRTGGWMHAAAEGFSSVLLDVTNPYHSSTWRHSEGALWDAAPHPLSLLCPVLGRVEAVSAVRGEADLVVLSLVHRSGAVSSLSLSHSVHVTAARSRTTLRGREGSAEAPVIADWDRRAVEAYRAALATVAGGRDQVTGESELSTDVHFGTHLTAILAAAETAMKTRRTVEIPHRPAGLGR